MNVGSLADLVSDYFGAKAEFAEHLPVFDSLAVALLSRVSKTVLRALEKVDLEDPLLPMAIACMI